MKIIYAQTKGGVLYIDASFEHEGVEVAIYNEPFDASLSGEELNIAIDQRIEEIKAGLDQ